MVDMTNISGKSLAEMPAGELKAWFDQRFAETMAQHEREKTPRLSIMVTKGTLDWAYPPFIIASTAAALGWEATLFFTFYGLGLLKKKLNLKFSTLGNPAMEMPMMGGHMAMPNLLSVMPGVGGAAGKMMKNLM